jgi:hypothetical protein
VEWLLWVPEKLADVKAGVKAGEGKRARLRCWPASRAWWEPHRLVDWIGASRAPQAVGKLHTLRLAHGAGDSDQDRLVDDAGCIHVLSLTLVALLTATCCHLVTDSSAVSSAHSQSKAPAISLLVQRNARAGPAPKQSLSRILSRQTRRPGCHCYLPSSVHAIRPQTLAPSAPIRVSEYSTCLPSAPFLTPP